MLIIKDVYTFYCLYNIDTSLLNRKTEQKQHNITQCNTILCASLLRQNLLQFGEDCMSDRCGCPWQTSPQSPDTEAEHRSGL